MPRATLFRSNGRQAVRLPESAAFPAGVREVAILRDGARRVIVPANALWDDFFASPSVALPDRAQPDRAQPAPPTRESL